MKNNNIKGNERLIKAFNDFALAYTNLNVVTDEYAININELESIKYYPFTESFDELDGITKWCNESVSEIREINRPLQEQYDAAKQAVIRTWEINTGGGCMVQTVKFLDNDKNVRWLYMSDGTWTVASLNYLEDEDYWNDAYTCDQYILYGGDSQCDIDIDDDTSEYKWFARIAYDLYNK